MLTIPLDAMQMSHLLFDPSTSVQQMAYKLLREAAHKRTEHLVVEAGVDTESVVKSLLPWELVSLLQQSLDIIDTEEDSSSVRHRTCLCQPLLIPLQRTFGALLGWMIILDLYTNAVSTYLRSLLHQFEPLRSP